MEITTMFQERKGRGGVQQEQLRNECIILPNVYVFRKTPKMML
jgi:hypothetical protein